LRAEVEGGGEAGDEPEQMEMEDDVDPVTVPPRPIPAIPQSHPLIGRQISNTEDGDVGVVTMWYWQKSGGSRKQRFLVRWNTPLVNKGKQTVWKDYSKAAIENNLV
jgi:hypothetical protein